MLKGDQMKISLLVSILLLLVFTGCNSSILDDPSIRITYSLDEDSQVKLTIQNSYETIIATLVDTIQSAGTYLVSFDANDLAEGVYFYTIEARNIESNLYFKDTKYLLLVK